MSKRKPDQVVEFRISLQDKERELLEHLVYVEGTAKAFNQFTEPFVEIFKDISAMTLILSTIALWMGWEFVLPLGMQTVEEIYAEFRRQLRVARESKEEVEKAAALMDAYLTPAWLKGLRRIFG